MGGDEILFGCRQASNTPRDPAEPLTRHHDLAQQGLADREVGVDCIGTQHGAARVGDGAVQAGGPNDGAAKLGKHVSQPLHGAQPADEEEAG